MNNYKLMKRIKEENKLISEDQLLEALLKFPLASVRSLRDLNAILNLNEIEEFTNAKELIFFIEKLSRNSEYSSLKASESLRLKEIKKKHAEMKRIKEENDQLFFSIMESQGLMGSKNTSECVGCGIVVAANAQCRC